MLFRSGKVQYKEPVTIEMCRIDRNTVFSRDTNEDKVVADAVIFTYADHTEPFIEFREQSKVTYDNKAKFITKVVYVSEPYSNKPFAYELEVKG